MHFPKISVLIPVNNAESSLESCLNLVFQQDYPDYEVILVDDFSTDKSYSIAQEISLMNNKLKPYKNPVKGGNNARNYAFTQSAGEYIQWLDADDFLLPGKFDKQVGFLQHSNYDIAYSDWRMDFYSRDKLVNGKTFIRKQYDDYIYELVRDNWAPLHDYLVRRKVALELYQAGIWNPKTRIAQDREYFMRAALMGATFGYVEGVFCVYNRFDNLSVSKMDFDKRLQVTLEKNHEYRKIIEELKTISPAQKKLYLATFNAQLISSFFYKQNLKLVYSFNPFLLNWRVIHYKQRALVPFLVLLALFSYLRARIELLPNFWLYLWKKLHFGSAVSIYFLSNLFCKLLKKEVKIDRLLDSALSWLFLALKKGKGIAISYGYSFENGWMPAYPETNGYLIDTLLSVHQFNHNKELLELAIRIGQWESQILHPSGAVRVGNFQNEQVDVFDTGMVILGLTSLYKETGNPDFLNVAEKAGNWLINVQDPDGKWSSYSFNGIPHVYHSKVDWALLKLFSLTNNIAFNNAAEQNLKWILSVKSENGWFSYQAFSNQENPFTHTMGYTIQGLLEAFTLLRDSPLRNRIWNSIIHYSNNLLDSFLLDMNKPSVFLLPGEINPDFTSGAKYVCLTGNLQFSLVFYRLYALTKNEKYFRAAENLFQVVASKYMMNSGRTRFFHGIPGSYPIGGNYQSFEYPNWPVKFFIDAMLERKKAENV